MGKGKSQTIGYKYLVGQHHILCHGPIDFIGQFEIDKRVAWRGRAEGGQVSVSAEELFGGEEREGGVSGLFDVEMGDNAQLQNDYLQGVVDPDVPGYRGVVGIVQRQAYQGNNPYLKPWAYKGQRIYVRQDGVEQWYPEKAGIPGGDTLLWPAGAPVSVSWWQSSENGNDPGNVWIGFVNSAGGVIGDYVQSPLAIFSDWTQRTVDGAVVPPDCAAIRIFANFIRGRFSWFNCSMDDFQLFVSGEEIELVNPGAELDDLGADGGLPGWHRDQGLVESRLSAEGIPAHSGARYFSGGIWPEPNMHQDVTVPQYLDMNPAHMIRECLTDPLWGMGYAEADVDDASFTAAADTLFAEGMGMSLLWDKETQIQEFVQTIVQHIDASLYVSRQTGKFVLTLIRDDYDVDDLILLDESNILKVTNPEEPTFAELSNSVTVNYWDNATSTDASLTIQDPALVQMQGNVINSSLQYPGFTNARNGLRVAQRDLKALSTPLFQCTIYANRDAKDLVLGQPFKFSWAKWQKSNVVMRATGLAYGDGKSSQIRVNCIQDGFATPTVPVQQVSGNAWVDPVRQPTAAADHIAFEAPYYEVVQAFGQTEVDGDLAANPDMGVVAAAAGRPSSGYHARVWTDDGSGYENVGALDFAPTCRIGSVIDQKASVIPFTDGRDLDLVEIGTHCQIGDGELTELCRVVAIDAVAGTVTLGRGVLDTPPHRHDAGTRIFFWDLFNGFDPTERVAGEVIDVKVTPSTGIGVLPLGSATADHVTLVSRPFRPYAPGNLLINAVSYPAADAVADGPVDVTWAHRDRLASTGSELFDHFHGDIGPEAGTTYTFRAYVDGVLDDEALGLTDPEYEWTPLATGSAQVKVWSVRDGYDSWQAASHEFFVLGAGVEGRLTEGGDIRMTEDGDTRITEE